MDVTLHNRTGNTRIDEILSALVEIFEIAFPKRIRGYYVTGSHASGDALPTSDIDGVILFKDDFVHAEEQARAFQLCRSCGRLLSSGLDVLPRPERDVMRYSDVSLKLNSLHIYGEDVRDDIPLPRMELHARLLMHEQFLYLMRIRGAPPYLIFPLDYPDPEAGFYGYLGHSVEEGDGNVAVDSAQTKVLVNCVGKLALAMVTLKARIFVSRKADCPRQYRAHIGDMWSDLVEQAHSLCRLQWQYRIPADETGRQQLRALCQQALAFENHFVALYRDFLVRELESDAKESLWIPASAAGILGTSADALRREADEGRLRSQIEEREERFLIEHWFQVQAARMLGKIIFPGNEQIWRALQSLERVQDEYLTATVRGTLQRILTATEGGSARRPP